MTHNALWPNFIFIFLFYMYHTLKRVNGKKRRRRPLMTYENTVMMILEERHEIYSFSSRTFLEGMYVYSCVLTVMTVEEVKEMIRIDIETVTFNAPISLAAPLWTQCETKKLLMDVHSTIQSACKNLFDIIFWTSIKNIRYNYKNN